MSVKQLKHYYFFYLSVCSWLIKGIKPTFVVVFFSFFVFPQILHKDSVVPGAEDFRVQKGRTVTKKLKVKVSVPSIPACQSILFILCWHSQRLQSFWYIRQFALFCSLAIWPYHIVSYHIISYHISPLISVGMDQCPNTLYTIHLSALISTQL